MFKENSNKKEYAVFALIVLIAVFVRIFRLGAPLLWLDESISYYRALQSVSQIVRNSYLYDAHPPTFYLIMHAMIQFGHSEFILRLFPALCGMLTVPVFYLFSSRIVGKKEAILATVFMAVSVFHVRYSQEARVYSLFLLICLFSIMLLWRVVTRGQRRDWLLWSVLQILNFYVHYFALFFLVIQLIIILVDVLLFHGKADRKEYLMGFLIGSAVMIAGCLPQLFFFIQQASYKTNPQTAFWHVSNPIKFLLIFIKNTHYPVTLHPPFWDRFLKYGFCVFYAWGGVLAWKRHPRVFLFYLNMLFFSVLLLWIGSFKMGISGTFRYVIYTIIPFAFWFGMAGNALSEWGARFVKRYFPKYKISFYRTQMIFILCLGLLLLGVNTFVLNQYYHERRSENWPEAVQILIDHFKPGDVVAPIPFFADYNIRYYLTDQKMWEFFIRMEPISTDAMKNCLSEHHGLFFIMTGHLYDRNIREQIMSWLNRNGQLLWQDDSFPRGQIWYVSNSP